MSPPSQSFSLLSNSALIDRCQYNDEDAFTEIFRRHRQMIYRVCLRYLGHHHDAEDVTQETFRRAALAMDRVDSHRPLEPWLVTIAANRCRTFLMRKQKDRLASRFDEDAWPSAAQGDIGHRFALGEQIEHALKRLPKHQRQAFELVHRSDLSYPEAASLLGRSTGTVKTWVHRAKLAMRDTLRTSSTLAPSVSATDTASAATASTASTGTGRLANRWTASALIALGLWSAGHLLERVSVLAPQSVDSPALAPAQASAQGSAPALHREGGADFIAPLEQRSSSLASLAAVDFQLISLQSFSQVQFSVDSIHALPVREWVQQTAPTLDHLRRGIEPLGATLQRTALLFQSEFAVLDPTPATRIAEDIGDTVS